MITEIEKISFELLCRRVASGELSPQGIGTYSEKRLHRALKYYMYSDEKCHEVRISKDGIALTESEHQGYESGRGGFIADIFNDGHIIEIQTAGFYPLKAKLEFYLERTDYKITVVHPVAAQKWITWIDPETGDVSKRSRSTKKGSLSDVIPELFWISKQLKNDRLDFKILLIELEEYRLLNGWSGDKKKGAEKYEKVPLSLFDIVYITPQNIAETLMPQGLDDEFSASHFAKLTKLKGRKSSQALKLMCEIGAIERSSKRGNAYIYRKVATQKI